MLDPTIIAYLTSKNCWYHEEDADYRQALVEAGINPTSDLATFYLHAEDGPTFYSRGRELYQLPWFLLNTPLAQHLYAVNESLGLSQDYLPLDSFEGENGFFYQASTGQVHHLASTQEKLQSWDTISDFLSWFFEL